MTEIQVLLRALAEAYAQIDGGRARVRELEAENDTLRERLSATENSVDEEMGG